MAQAFGGEFRVQRHIGTAGFQYREQSHHQLRRALQADADQRIRPYPGCAQAMGKAVGCSIQLGVAEANGILTQRHRIRHRPRLLLKTTYQIEAGLVATARGAGFKLRGALFKAEQRQLAHRTRWLGNQSLQQIEEVPGHALDGGAVEQVAGVVEGAVEAAVGALVDEQAKVDLRAVAAVGEALQAQPRQLLVQRHRVPLQAEQHLEQRVVAEAAFRLQGFHQLFERQVLVRLGGQHGFPYLLQQCSEGLAGIDARAQHLGVDEQADQPLALAALAVGDRHADTEVVLAAVALQQQVEGRQQ
ncbi:hypothetical protein D9M71_65040 [compost metagenome]